MSSQFLAGGGRLSDLLGQHGPLEPTRGAWIATQIAAALDAVHAQGQLYRDVRPENVLLNADGSAYLADPADPAGDPNYRAPEQLAGGPLGPQTDVYALACVLYECLTGRPPFERADSQEVINAHLFSPPPRPSIMRRGIGPAFNDVIALGMAKQPAARFSSAGELARAASVAAASGVEPTSTPPFGIVYPNPDDTGYSPYPPAANRSQSRINQIPLFVAAAAVLMLTVAAVLAVISALGDIGHRQRAASPPPPALPAPATTTPSLSRPVQGADGLGFVGHSARCDPGNPPAAVVRTAQSLAVVCQQRSGSFYYRGERIRDGANIELANAVRASGGFDVTNPANGVRYEVRPHRLTIMSNGHVDSAEPVLQYASAG